MNKQELVDFLLENAGESIKYRLHCEILGTSINDPIMSQLQKRILKQRRVQKIFSHQHADGWIGDNIYGGIGAGLDASTFALRAYGVEANNEGSRRAKQALLNPGVGEMDLIIFPSWRIIFR
jgi:hypothetical protein